MIDVIMFFVLINCTLIKREAGMIKKKWKVVLGARCNLSCHSEWNHWIKVRVCFLGWWTWLKLVQHVTRVQHLVPKEFYHVPHSNPTNMTRSTWWAWASTCQHKALCLWLCTHSKS